MMGSKKVRINSVSYGWAYLFGVWAIHMIICGSFALMVGVVESTTAVVMTSVIGSLLAGLCSGVYIEGNLYKKNDDKKKTIASAVKSKTVFKTLVFDTAKYSTKTYYPEVQAVITPFFSFAAIFTPISAIFTLIAITSLWYLSGDLQVASLAAAVGFALSWVWYILLSGNTIKRVWAISQRQKLKLVTTNHSANNLLRMIAKIPPVENAWGEDVKNRMRYIAQQGVDVAYSLNNMIVAGAADANLFKAELALIDHALNTFIPETTTTLNNFFEKHAGKKVAARKVYERDILPLVRKETVEVYEKIYDINSTLVRLEDKQLLELAKQDEDAISADAALLKLTESKALPLPNFSEFHTLEFESVEKKVAAKSIVMRSIDTLVAARENSTDKVIVEKIDEQIRKTKIFIYSLAVGTSESTSRDNRLQLESENDPLSLRQDFKSVDDIDSLISVEQRYIDAYDKTLPPSRHKKTRT